MDDEEEKDEQKQVQQQREPAKSADMVKITDGGKKAVKEESHTCSELGFWDFFGSLEHKQRRGVQRVRVSSALGRKAQG